MAARSPNGDLPMIAGFIVVRRRSTGAPTVTAEHPDDRRRDTGGASTENLVISSGNRPVAEQSPYSGARWLTLRHGSRSRKSGGELPISKNRHPAKIYRHRAIYVSWDVGFITYWAQTFIEHLHILSTHLCTYLDWRIHSCWYMSH